MGKLKGSDAEIISSINLYLIKEGKKMMVGISMEDTSETLKKFHEKYKINFDELKNRLDDDLLYQTYVIRINEEICF